MALSIGTPTTSSSSTFSHTVASGTDVLVVTSVARRSAGAPGITGITYNGTAMTQAAYYNSGQITQAVYVLEAPDTGANNVVITFGNTPDGQYNSATDVDGNITSGSFLGTTGTDTDAGDGGGAGSFTASATATVTGEAGVVFATVQNFDSPTYTVDTVTALYDNQAASTAKTSGGYRLHTGSSINLDWDASYAGAHNASIIVYAEIEEYIPTEFTASVTESVSVSEVVSLLLTLFVTVTETAISASEVVTATLTKLWVRTSKPVTSWINQDKF